MDQLAAWLDRYHVNLLALVMTVVLLGGAVVVIFLVNRLLKSWLLRAEPVLNLPRETIPAIMRVVTGLLWLVTFLLVLGVWGVGVGGLWTLLVSVAAVVGVGFFATWTMVSNITASLFLAIWRPFKLGDGVEILPEGLRGRVIDRNMMFVMLREDEGGTVHIPNNLFFQKMVRVIGDSDPSLFKAAGSEEGKTPKV